MNIAARPPTPFCRSERRAGGAHAAGKKRTSWKGALELLTVGACDENLALAAQSGGGTHTHTHAGTGRDGQRGATNHEQGAAFLFQNVSILSARPRRGRTPSVPVVVATARTMLVGQPQSGPWQPLRPTPRLRRFSVSCRVFLFLSCALALFRSFAQCRLRAPLVFFSCLRCELAAGVLPPLRPVLRPDR